MSGQAEGLRTPKGAVRAGDLERLTFTPAGLVHWLVVDVVAGIAAQNGQREDSDWLRDLPTPVKRSSPSGSMEVLERVGDQSMVTWMRTWNETNRIQRVDSAKIQAQPYWFNACLWGTGQLGLWVRAVHEARSIAQRALETAALRDRQEELAVVPVENDMGWRATFLESAEFHLWSHAREVTFLPFDFDEAAEGLLFGGESRWWSEDRPEQKVVELRY